MLSGHRIKADYYYVQEAGKLGYVTCHVSHQANNFRPFLLALSLKHEFKINTLIAQLVWWKFQWNICKNKSSIKIIINCCSWMRTWRVYILQLFKEITKVFKIYWVVVYCQFHFTIPQPNPIYYNYSMRQWTILFVWSYNDFYVTFTSYLWWKSL